MAGQRKVVSLLLKHWGLEPNESLLLVLIAMEPRNSLPPMEYDCYTNTEVFLSWVEDCLCKELKPNQVVIMDNASFHKSNKVKELIEKIGGRLM